MEGQQHRTTIMAGQAKSGPCEEQKDLVLGFGKQNILTFDGLVLNFVGHCERYA